MNCPYLRHIVFTKINQLENREQQDVEATVDQKEPHSCEDEAQEENDIQKKVGRLRMPTGLQLNFIGDESQLKEQDKIGDYGILTVQMAETYLAQTMDSFELSSIEEQHINKQPYVLVNKPMPNFNRKKSDPPTFDSQIFIVESLGHYKLQHGVYHCQIENGSVKLFQNKELKLFLDFQRHDVNCFVEKQYVKMHINGTKPSYIKLRVKDPKQFCRIFHHYSCQSNFDKDTSIDTMSLQIPSIAYSKMKYEGDSLDILLFKNKTFLSKVQRFLTNANYDHVAMLLKSSTNELFIYECTSTYGVSVYPLDSFTKVDCKKYYQRICYRKLNIKRKVEQIVALEKFVKSSVGKKYNFNPTYLVKQSKSPEELDTYFCSDLVAKALQETGLISRRDCSSQFLPKHFCDEYNLELQDCHYEPSKIVMFDR